MLEAIVSKGPFILALLVSVVGKVFNKLLKLWYRWHGAGAQGESTRGGQDASVS